MNSATQTTRIGSVSIEGEATMAARWYINDENIQSCSLLQRLAKKEINLSSTYYNIPRTRLYYYTIIHTTTGGSTGPLLVQNDTRDIQKLTHEQEKTLQ